MNFMHKIRYNEVKEGDAPGAPPAPPKPSQQPPAPPSNPPPEASGDTVDEFGYQNPETPPVPGDKTKEGNPPPPKAGEPPAPAKVEKPATGYGEPPPKVEAPPAPPAPKTEPPAAPDEIDKVLEGLPKEDMAGIKGFVTKHNIPVDAAKEFAEMRKDEIKQAEAWANQRKTEAANAELRQKAQYYEELKQDSTFGGENFDRNVQNVEKLVEDFFPQTKKKLTDSKGMLPPYLMRDLAKLHEHLNKPETLVQGAPVVEKSPAQDDEDAHLTFYK